MWSEGCNVAYYNRISPVVKETMYKAVDYALATYRLGPPMSPRYAAGYAAHATRSGVTSDRIERSLEMRKAWLTSVILWQYVVPGQRSYISSHHVGRHDIQLRPKPFACEYPYPKRSTNS